MRRPLALALAAGALVVGLALVVVLVLDGGGGDDAPPPATVAGPARAPAPRGDPVAHLRAIAGAVRNGTRAAGTAGDRATADLLVRRLRAAGLRVRTQLVRVPYSASRGRPAIVAAGVPGARLRARADVRALAFSPGGRARGALRVVGLDPGRASDAGCAPGDLRAVGRGDVVLVQRGTCTLRRKALNAQRAGAGAVLVANDGRPGRTTTFPGTLGRPGVRIPALLVSTRAAGALRAAAGEPVTVVARTVSETRTSRNVVAETAGGDPERVVMAGAHLDSVAEGPGLNDNGSGVAAVLAVAERLAERPPGGARLRVGFWAAEEIGLVGSRRYVASLTRAERARIAVYVNLDMVGSPNPAAMVYSSRPGEEGERIERVLRSAVARSGRTPRATSLGGGSDHASFRRAGVPVGGLFTGAGAPRDPCYHRPCDDLGNVDRSVLRDLTEATERALATLGAP